jgi:hypothetical protein
VRDFDLIRIDISVTQGLALVTNFIGACETEVGYEAGGELSERCLVSEYAANGIMKNIDFALKDDLTCVKDQGSRGSCAAHAINACVETQVLANGGSAENLSEQHTYFTGKVSTNWNDRYQSGLVTPDVLAEFVQEGYRFQFESVWNYNRSLSIDPLDPNTSTRPDSCVGYTGEMCTDYEFQAEEDVTYLFGFPSSIDYDYPEGTPNSGHVLTSTAQVADFGYPIGVVEEVQLAIVATTVESDQPVIARISVPPAFRAPDADGYVRFVANQVSSGSHAILVVGYVANADLPAGVEDDPGPLGGYFVIKNSWGTGYADCGFAYLSSEFLDAWAVGFHTVTVN